MDQIQHFSHPHPLTLVLHNEMDAGYLGLCKICREIIEGVSDDGYGCKKCHFYIHKSCAVFPYELQHPSHPKHLLLLEPHYWERCANCNSYLFQFKYKCPHCHEFYLCPECAFLPLTKKAENHDHPLNLMQKLLPFMCDHCLKEGNNMPYFCSTCSFTVHSKCTSLPLIVRPPTIQNAIHSHPLTLMPALTISPTCDACGNKTNGRFYFCAICSFVAHLDCALSPSIVKVKRHKHPLNLIYSLPADQSQRRVVCQICVKTVDTNYWLYCCSSYDFVAHLHCATKEEEIDETFVPNSKEDHNDKSIDLLPAYIVKKTKPAEGDGTEIHTEIKHFSHEHDLQLTDHGSGIDKKCNGCIRSIFPPFYECAQCGFFLHKSCVELPTELRSSLHRHPLKLIFLGERSKLSNFCDACRHWCNGFVYHCATSECDFNLDVQCSSIPDILKVHPSHEHDHQLILSSSLENKRCSSCGSEGSYNFSCVDCEFTLDFKCLTLPRTMNYEKHDHPFTLCYTSEDDSGEYYCDICEEKRDPKCWFYYCADCSYPAHPKCILGNHPRIKFGKTIQAAIHNHSLTLHETNFSFTCDACGNEGKEAFYFCAICSFVAHLDCAFLPSIVKVKRHKHPLNLIYSLPADQSKRRVVCQICVKTVDTNYWLYCCSSHDFVAHFHCATKKEEIDETFVPNSKEDHNDKSIDLLLAYIVKKTKPAEGDGTEIHTEIKHFSHEHDLQLTDHGSGIDKKCDGCIRSIFPPFYECAQCGFFLHKSCVELPTELRSSLHRHPLKLILGERKLSILCNACRHWCNGFVYHCAECNFNLDVQCSSISDILKVHPSHKYDHQLILALEDKTCSSCGSKGRYNFSCVDCEFTLDFKCLTLPRTMNYEKHDHPFTLCYTSEDDSGEYYCDICEEKRDPKLWFYYCADCSYPAHPECILGNHPKIKFGKTFKYDFHQHPVTLVEKTRAQCSECGSLFNEDDLAYECAECNFIVHRWCLEGN